MDFFKTVFSEDTWNIYLVDDNDDVIAEADSGAETDLEKKEIHFRKSQITLITVMHELWHVYFFYCHLEDTTELSLSDMEEISASLFCRRGEKIIERSYEIFHKLIELKNRPEIHDNV